MTAGDPADTFATLYLRPPAGALAVSAAWVGSVIALAMTAVVVAYLLKSRRVRNTFVR